MYLTSGAEDMLEAPPVLSCLAVAYAIQVLLAIIAGKPGTVLGPMYGVLREAVLVKENFVLLTTMALLLLWGPKGRFMFVDQEYISQWIHSGKLTFETTISAIH